MLKEHQIALDEQTRKLKYGFNGLNGRFDEQSKNLDELKELIIKYIIKKKNNE